MLIFFTMLVVFLGFSYGTMDYLIKLYTIENNEVKDFKLIKTYQWEV